MRKSSFYVVAIISMLVLAGCLPRTQPYEYNCPKPQQNCSPGQWSGIPYDTSAAMVKVQKEYFIFEPVKQLNTPNDEWCLSFISPKQAVVTFTDENQQRAMMVRMLDDNRTTTESGLGGPLDGSMGAFSFKNNDVIFSASLSEELPASSDLYSGKLKGNVLVDVMSLGQEINTNPTTWESQPALSPDGDVLFFASDKWMETKGVDLWYSVKMQDGSWGEPVNCGDSINSHCDEITPFVTKDGKHLLFSSNGHSTVGGYDIFEADISNTFWTAVKQRDFKTLKSFNFFSYVKNLRPPLNTKADEIFPSSPNDVDSLLYYSSNQFATEPSAIIMQRGGFDIFVRRKVVKEDKDFAARKKEVTTEVPVADEDRSKLPDFNISPTYELEGTVYNDNTKLPLEDADVKVKEIPDNNNTRETKTDKFGKYKFTLEKGKEYDIIAEARNLFFSHYSLRVDQLDTVKKVTQNMYIPLELTLRINFPTDKYDTPYKYILDSNGVETNFTWEKELNVLAENILSSKEGIKKIIFVGHTDDIGTSEYNMQLGQKRVDFLRAQLVQRGVPGNMLEGNSAGKTELKKQLSGEDQRMWRKRCRRVELRKIMKSE